MLPAAYYSVYAPTTVTINDTTARIMGADMTDGSHVVVGQTMEAVAEAQATIILAEILIGPILLLVVFLGAVAIGRRVAAPIEQARQRQMEFTADASHELRTPLSVIEAHTSLALAQERSGEWYRDAFGRIDREVAADAQTPRRPAVAGPLRCHRRPAERRADRPRRARGSDGRSVRDHRPEARTSPCPWMRRPAAT